MLFVAALLPVVIYIFVVYKIDNFSLISIKNLFLQVLCGMVAALACFGLFQLTGLILSENQSDFFNPVLEEIIKAIPLLCILENIFYLLLGNEMGIGTVLFRGLEVALIHMGCSAIIAAGLMLGIRLILRSRSRLAIKNSNAHQNQDL